MIYLVGSTKGGVGKTTAAVNLAAWLARSGRRVLVVDADAQQHATQWVVSRVDPALLGTIRVAQARGRQTGALIEHYARDSDDTVVDAGGRDSFELRGAMTVAHALLSPVVPSQFDLYAARDTAALITESRLFNEELRAYVFINKASPNWVLKSDAEQARRFLDEMSHVHRLLAAQICLRRAFATSVEEGRAVFEMGRRGAQAGAEFEALCEELAAQVTV